MAVNPSVLDVLSSDLKILSDALDEAWPTWFADTAREHATDAAGRVHESRCIPALAAAQLIRERAAPNDVRPT